MLNQLSINLFEYLLTYSPNIAGIIFYAIILVFAILMYKRNSYTYGITLMISSILVLVSEIIYMAIQYPFLAYRLSVELGLPLFEVAFILTIWSIVFLIINVISTIFLVVSIYLIYKTHKKDRID